MRVSVVIPTYNAAARLHRTVASVIAQTRPADEIIVVDDGSTDHTAAVLDHFGCAVTAVSVPNGGQQRARNIGVERAQGEWIALLDHDDIWRPEYLAEVTTLIGTHEVDAVICNSDIVLEEGARGAVDTPDRFRRFAPEGYWESLGVDPHSRWSALERYGLTQYLRFHPAQPSVLTVRRDLYKRLGGFDSRMRGNGAENFEFELRLVRTARIGLIWRPLVAITRHAENASADRSSMAIDLVACLDFVLAHHELDSAERETVLAERRRRLPAAVDGAFSLRRLDALRAYCAEAQASLSSKQRLKLWLAGLPGPLARLAATVLTRGLAR